MEHLPAAIIKQFGFGLQAGLLRISSERVSQDHPRLSIEITQTLF
jgi:hypothetical protein